MTDGYVNVDRTVSSITSTLLQRVQDGDQESWATIVQVYGPLVLLWCKVRQLPHEDAADVCQEVFVAVARKVGDFERDGPDSTFRGWLRTITENKIRDYWRKAKGRPRARGGSTAQQKFEGVVFEDFDKREPTPEDENQLLFWQMLELVRVEFSPEHWNIFTQTILEEKEPAAVAAELGISRNKVYVVCSRVRKRFRELWGNLPDSNFPNF